MSDKQMYLILGILGVISSILTLVLFLIKDNALYLVLLCMSVSSAVKDFKVWYNEDETEAEDQ